MKKVVFKLDFPDEKIKQKAMKKVSALSGLESIVLDPKDKTLTVTGDIDPAAVVARLRKICLTDIVYVGPANEPEKEEEEENEEPEKEEEEANEEQEEEEENEEPPPYYHKSVEEDPNGCVIC